MAKAADVSKSLDRALKKLNANDHAGALDELLTAWRSKRIARIANLIDRVSDVVTAARGGEIKGKSVKERTEKWLKVAKKKDACDVGVLLATPWPGTWEHAIPVIEGMTKFPDDPRIAMALTQMVDKTPYDTWTSVAFYRRLFAYLTKQLDLRTLPTLATQLERTDRSHYWKRGTKQLEIAAVTKLESYAKKEATLSASEETALAAVEALYARAATAEKSDAKNEADFLNAIYESPDDDSLRAVFADWLTERNDPRGEFISLQLARADGRATTDASHRREAALLKKHGPTWLGKLDRIIEKDGREFERGFLSGGVAQIDDYPDAPPKDFSDPALATMRSLSLTWRAQFRPGVGAAFADLPPLKNLRVLRDLDESTLVALVRGPVRERFEEIDFIIRTIEDDAEDRDECLAMRAEIIAKAHITFPNVKALSLTGNVSAIEWVLTTPIAKKAERITINDSYYPLADLIASVGRLNLPATDLQARYSSRRSSANWIFSAARDADGRFTKIHGESDGVSSIPSRYALESLLNGFAPNDLTELTIDRERVCSYDESDIRTIEEHLAKFTRLSKIEVPWERVGADQDASSDGAGDGSSNKLAISLHLEGKRLCSTKDIPKIWDLIHEAPVSLAVDSYSVNGGKHTPLPTTEREGVCEHINETIEKKRTSYVLLYRKGASETCSIRLSPFKPSRWRRDVRETISVTCAYDPKDPKFADAFIPWLVRLLDALNVDEGYMRFAFPPDVESVDGADYTDYDTSLEPLRSSPPYGWLSILGPKHATRVPFDALRKLAGSKDLEGLRVLQSERNALLIASASPSTVAGGPAFILAYQIGLLTAMWQSYKERWKTTPRDVMIEVLTAPLKKLGFKLAELEPLPTALGHLYFVAREESGARAIYFELEAMIGDPRLGIEMRHAPNDKNADLSKDQDLPRQQRSYAGGRYWGAAGKEKELRSYLKKFLDGLDTEMIWFENRPPEPKPARRKRR